jgi:hypothetical protein
MNILKYIVIGLLILAFCVVAEFLGAVTNGYSNNITEKQEVIKRRHNA